MCVGGCVCGGVCGCVGVVGVCGCACVSVNVIRCNSDPLHLL